MFEYLFDVVLAFRTYAAYALGIIFAMIAVKYATRVIVKPDSENYQELIKVSSTVQTVLRLVLGLVLIVGVYLSAASPSRTPKNVVFDNTQKNRQITQQILSTPKGEIVDRTRSPKHTDEERKARFDEMVKY